MSGADEDYQEVARMVGARRGFRKPVRVAELIAIVREVVVLPPMRSKMNPVEGSSTWKTCSSIR